MLLKILTLLGVLLALYGLARRLGALVQPPSSRTVQAAEMDQCRACGAWHARGEPCRCAEPHTP